jgi:hypothetical protein
MKLNMFRTVPLSIMRSFSLYTQQWYTSYRFADRCKQDEDGTAFHPHPAFHNISHHIKKNISPVDVRVISVTYVTGQFALA